MKKLDLPSPVKIIIGLISNNDEIINKTSFLLSKKLGPIEFESKFFPFNITSYYNDELGEGLKRKFLSFEKIFNLEKIYKIKIFTTKLENKFSILGKRKINIDPGYITLSKLVLLTKKDYSHRIYLKNGIYAEVTLHYRNKTFKPWEWTYPDYKMNEYIHFFNQIRENFAKSLRDRNINISNYQKINKIKNQ